MPRENVIQAMLAFMIGLVIVLLANNLASIPLRARAVRLDSNDRRFRILRAFWICCGVLWVIGGAFLLIDPSLAIQWHASSGVAR